MTDAVGRVPAGLSAKQATTQVELGASRHGWMRPPRVAAVTMVAMALAPSPPRLVTARLEGQTFVGASSEGELRGAQLIGAQFTIRGTRLLVVDLRNDDQSGLELFRLRRVDEEEHEYCLPDPDGERWALVVDEGNGLEFTCTAGARGKCTRWGYGTDRRDLHDACIRMVRADYLGDGLSHTVAGTRIRYCDRVGIHPCPADLRHLEAAWAPTGAVCVASPRVPALASLSELHRAAPNLPLGDACSYATASSDSRALLFEVSLDADETAVEP